MRKALSILTLIVFFFQIGYLSYRLPQIIILGEEFPPEIKLSAIIAGICLGILLLLKEYTTPFK